MQRFQITKDMYRRVLADLALSSVMSVIMKLIQKRLFTFIKCTTSFYSKSSFKILFCLFSALDLNIYCTFNRNHLYKFNYCSKYMTKYNNMTRHEESCRLKLFVCDLCHVKCAPEKALFKHVQRKHWNVKFGCMQL